MWDSVNHETMAHCPLLVNMVTAGFMGVVVLKRGGGKAFTNILLAAKRTYSQRKRFLNIKRKDRLKEGRSSLYYINRFKKYLFHRMCSVAKRFIVYREDHQAYFSPGNLLGDKSNDLFEPLAEAFRIS